jgi:hypothetical protein
MSARWGREAPRSQLNNRGAIITFSELGLTGENWITIHCLIQRVYI